MAVGKTRAKQRLHDDGDYNYNAQRERSHKVMCLQLHGDGAFAGQVYTIKLHHIFSLICFVLVMLET